MDYEISKEILDEIQDLAHKGRKIEAIKRFREVSGVDLKEAKEAVEAMIDKNPNLSEAIGPKGCASVVLLMLASAVVVMASLI